MSRRPAPVAGLTRTGRGKRLPRHGGRCAPSRNLYDLCRCEPGEHDKLLRRHCLGQLTCNCSPQFLKRAEDRHEITNTGSRCHRAVRDGGWECFNEDIIIPVDVKLPATFNINPSSATSFNQGRRSGLATTSTKPLKTTSRADGWLTSSLDRGNVRRHGVGHRLD